MIYLLIPLILIAGTIAMLAFFLLRRKQARKPFEQVATSLGLDLTYSHPQDFMLSGWYRSYPLTLITLPIATQASPTLPCYKASVPMTNPQGKIFVVEKGSLRYDRELAAAPLIPLKETFSPGLTGRSNDLLFSSVLLTEQVKATIERFFAGVYMGQLFIAGDELTVIVANEKRADLLPLCMDLLADIKDSLRS